MKCLRGIPASMGVAIGPVHLLDAAHSLVPHRRVSKSDVASERERFREAISASRAEIEAAREELIDKHGADYAPILEVHALMHGDALLIDAVDRLVETELFNVEWALERTLAELKRPLLSGPSGYFRERARDIDHVGKHLLRHLGASAAGPAVPTEPAIIVARDLSPADAVRVLGDSAIGLVTALGSATGHTAVLARALEVPAVVGVGELPQELHGDVTAIVDGFSGEATFSPTDAEARSAHARRARFVSFAKKLRSEHNKPSVTTDGVPISVCANVELPSEIDSAVEYGAEGIGLYRTEFICLERGEVPSEDEQAHLYADIARTLGSQSVVFRTFDFGGDKMPSTDHPTFEALRVAFDESDLLVPQLRAILRASEQGNIQLMFPMVTGVEELRALRDTLDACVTELRDSGTPVGDVSVGIMVEVPAAALMAHQLAPHCDFFSVGTNDLVRYTLALDRRDSNATLTEPMDPAVLRLLFQTQDAAAAHDVGCTMCGDMAGHPLGLVLAVGLGYRRLSVPVGMVPLVRAAVRQLSASEAEDVASEALQCESARDVRALVIERMKEQLGPLWTEQGVLRLD